MTVIWIIDDSRHWHEVAQATIDHAGPPWVLGRFMQAAPAIDAWQQRIASGEPAAPAIILMDFFMPGLRGDEATRRFRELQGTRPLVIVGYSSTKPGSEAILRAGGTLILPKVEGPGGRNPHLLRYLNTWQHETP